MTTSTLSRGLYGLLLFSLGLTEWFVKQFNPAENATYWLAAGMGSLALRLLFPKTPVVRSLSGWFIGFVFACLTAKTALKDHWFGSFEPELVWATLGFAGDAGLQLGATLNRIVQKILGFAEATPGDAFDQGLTRAERFFELYAKIKQPVWDFLSHFISKKSP